MIAEDKKGAKEKNVVDYEKEELEFQLDEDLVHEGGRNNRFTEDWNSDEEQPDNYEINDEEISKIIIGKAMEVCCCAAISRQWV